jgi:hypothetical protein
VRGRGHRDGPQARAQLGENEGVEWLRIRWGRVHSLEVFLDTERVSSWEARHPDFAVLSAERPR